MFSQVHSDMWGFTALRNAMFMKAREIPQSGEEKLRSQTDQNQDDRQRELKTT